MKVLLISPFCQDSQYPFFLPSENLGLAYIAAYLRKNGVSVDILDANMHEWRSERIITEVDMTQYGLFGIGVSSYLLLSEALKISKEIKSINPACHINIGGHFATFQAKKILETGVSIDSVVMRDGEATMLDLAENLSGAKNLDDVLGLCFRDKSGNIKTNNPRPLVQELDSLPWPARDTLLYLKELSHSWPTQISSSRGCYGSCAYCDMPNFYGRSWRARSAKDVVDEIEYLNREYGSRVFRFSDDEFIGPKPRGPKRAREIALEILKRNLAVELMIDARAQAVDRDLFSLLKDAGVVDCLIGVESGVDRILKLYNKGMTVKDNLKAIQVLKELGISLNLAFIMIDPRMTFEELKENYRFLKENDIVTSYSLKTWLWPLHGTPLVRQLKSQRLVTRDGLEQIEYRFIDSEVKKVFNAIKKSKNYCYPLEREIFVCTKYNLLPKDDLKKAIDDEKLLWIEIFETVLNNPEWDNYGSLEIKIRHQIENIRKRRLKRQEE